MIAKSTFPEEIIYADIKSICALSCGSGKKKCCKKYKKKGKGPCKKCPKNIA